MEGRSVRRVAFEEGIRGERRGETRGERRGTEAAFDDDTDRETINGSIDRERPRLRPEQKERIKKGQIPRHKLSRSYKIVRNQTSWRSTEEWT